MFQFPTYEDFRRARISDLVRFMRYLGMPISRRRHLESPGSYRARLAKLIVRARKRSAHEPPRFATTVASPEEENDKEASHDAA
jgi:hypothetical protein